MLSIQVASILVNVHFYQMVVHRADKKKQRSRCLSILYLSCQGHFPSAEDKQRARIVTKNTWVFDKSDFDRV